ALLLGERKRVTQGSFNIAECEQRFASFQVAGHRKEGVFESARRVSKASWGTLVLRCSAQASEPGVDLVEQPDLWNVSRVVAAFVCCIVSLAIARCHRHPKETINASTDAESRNGASKIQTCGCFAFADCRSSLGE